MASTRKKVSNKSKKKERVKKRPKKLCDEDIIIALENNEYRTDLEHAKVRSGQRNIPLPTAIQMLKGKTSERYRVPGKDLWDAKFKNWKYRLHGKDHDGVRFGVVVVICDTNIIITVLDKVKI